MGKKAVILALDDHLGGLSSGGLGATEYREQGGGSGGFRASSTGGWGSTTATRRTGRFEPSAAEKVFEDFVREAGIPVYRRQHLAKVVKEGNVIREIHMDSGAVYRAKVFIDTSYEGDLLAMAGGAYHVGREANRVYKETLNGVYFGHPNHSFRAWVDPYNEAGNPASGLLPGVQDVPHGFQGQGDACVQAYNFRVCLTDVAANQVGVSQARIL